MHRFRVPAWFVLASLIVFLSPRSWDSALAHQAALDDPAIAPLGPSAPAVTDLVIDDVEVTQGIQDLNNSVPLIEGKRTFVRVYAHSTSGIHPTTAILEVDVGLLHQTLLPIAPGGPLINVRPAYNRLVPNHAFLFELPLWATFADGLTLTAVVNPVLPWHPHDPMETTYSNNSLAVVVNYDSVPKLHLVIASQPYTFGGLMYTPGPYDQWKSAEWLARVYPLSQVKVYFRTLPTLAAQRQLDANGLWDLTWPYCNWLGYYLAYNHAWLVNGPFGPNNIAYAAIVSDEVGFMRGCADRGGLLTANGYARTAAGPVGDKTWGWDFDGSYADWYTGHELGHAFGRPHVRGGPGYVKDGCGGEAKAVKHNLNGRISPTTNIFDPTAIYGFDTLHLIQGINPILGPMYSDVMTYCPYQWISKVTYLKLKEVLEAGLTEDANDALTQGGPQDVLAVFGSLDPATEAVTLLPISTLFDAPNVMPPTPGAYAIVLHNSDGDELARHPFTPGGLAESEGDGPAPADGPEVILASIAQLVPVVAGATNLEIEGPSGVLHEVNAGLALPVVQVTAPNGGEVFGEFDEVTVTWTASDIDGDPLTFNVEYSPDNGVSWEPLALFITATQVTLDPVNLREGANALVRVSASDGLHTARDSSNIFAVLNHTPTGEIITPASDVTIAVSQTIALEGRVYDNDLGMLEDANLEWFSDLDGSLGNGALVSTAGLSEGLHEISLVADDGHGQFPIDQVMVTVVATPLALPAQADRLLAGPDLVFLLPSEGIVSGTIYLDNVNLGDAISWQATPQMDWLQLSSGAGQTPQDLVVTTNLGPYDVGTHKSLVTFSSPVAAFDPVYVVVIVTIPEYRLYLPGVLR